MTKLSKVQKERQAELVRKLNVKASAVESAIDRFNDREELKRRVVESLDEYMSALAESRAFREEIADSLEAYKNERSEKWQESEAGSDYESWIDSWRDCELDDIDFEFPEQMGIPELDAAESLEQIGDSP